MGKWMENERSSGWLQPNALASVRDQPFTISARALRNFLASEIQRETAKTLGRGGQQAAELPNRTGKFI
jgi:hypothetical protein